MKTLLSLIAAGLLMMAAGCNTVEGLGKDISKAGDAIENAARKTK